MATTPVHADFLRHRALADPTRVSILAVIDESDDPVGVEDIAEATGVHPNTVRGHLATLETAGLVRRTREPRTERGRPRHLYQTTVPEDSAQRYRRLATVLIDALSSSDRVSPVRAVRDAARAHADAASALVADESVDAVDALATQLGIQGFAPRPDPDDATNILLDACPFAELVSEDGAIVCAAHLGLLEGAVGDRDDIAIDGLDPLFEGHTCRVRLRR